MLDVVEIEAVGGMGGRGAVSFRREKYVPRGGPDGGRGGRGGDVIVQANAQLNTLRRYRRQRIFRAEAGAPGGTNNRRGRAGASLILQLPVGAVVSRVKPDGLEQLVDLREHGESMLAAWGGDGGYGNTWFKSSTNRAPRVAQRGGEGERLRLRIELRVLADIGIVGLPNAGKSSLLRLLSSARPRVAAYPFTTLEPHLGVVETGWDEVVVADLPGLIEGAADGAGLGHDFLRHASRTRVLLHLIDGSSEDPVAARETINRELAAYSAELAATPQIVAINKADLPEVQQRRAALEAAFGDTPTLFCSALSGDGAQAAIEACVDRLQQVRAEDAETPLPPPTLRPKPDRRRFTIEQLRDRAFRVHGAGVEHFVAMMDLEDEQGLAETYRWLERRGVAAALQRAGAQPGDRVAIGRSALTWEWER